MTLDASLIIPTYNKKKFLELTLTSLIHQTYPHESFEVVIIDDGSTDGTHELFSTSTRFPFQHVYVKQKNAGRSAARNAGILRAKGETIIFIDDDQIVPSQFVESHLRPHQQNRNLVVGGYHAHVFSFVPDALRPRAILSYLQKSFPKQENLSDLRSEDPLIAAEDINSDFNQVTRLSYGMDVNFERISRIYGEDLKGFFIPWIFFVTCNVSVGKSHLLELGLFDENFIGWGIEDYEMGYRLCKHGIEYKLCRDAISYHQFHSRNFVQARESELINYQYFCKKHPDVAVFLYWRKTYDGLNIVDYSAIVQDYCGLAETVPGCQLLSDYKDLLKHRLETRGFNLALRQEFWQLPSLAEKALEDKKYEKALFFALKYINLNAHRADEQQSTLKEFPTLPLYDSYSHLNTVAFCWLVVASAYAAKGEVQKALEATDQIVNKYPFAQHWDVKKGLVKLVNMAEQKIKECANAEPIESFV